MYHFHPSLTVNASHIYTQRISSASASLCVLTPAQMQTYCVCTWKPKRWEQIKSAAEINFSRPPWCDWEWQNADGCPSVHLSICLLLWLKLDLAPRFRWARVTEGAPDGARKTLIHLLVPLDLCLSDHFWNLWAKVDIRDGGRRWCVSSGITFCCLPCRPPSCTLQTGRN